MPIKFVDLAAQNDEIRKAVDAEHQRIHDLTAYVGGPQVAEFESRFADYLGVRYVIGVASGTDALRLALIAAGVQPGHEVITTPMTFIATVEAILQAGAVPAFVDVDPDSANISVEGIERYLASGRFRSPKGPGAIVPVHLYGSPVPMEPLMELASRYRLPVIEDACQAHGARMYVGGRWRRAGAAGAAGCFSFYPGKNLGAWGEGGAVTTDDSGLAARVALLRDHGRVSHYLHQESGYNARLDTIQAAVLLAKLDRLEDWNARRRAIARRYCELLAGCGVVSPSEPEGTESCYHLFVVRSEKRDRIFEALSKAGIGCGIHYPVPLHLQPACCMLGHHRGDFAVSEYIADTVISLPMHPHLTDEQVCTIARAVRAALGSD